MRELIEFKRAIPRRTVLEEEAIDGMVVCAEEVYLRRGDGRIVMCDEFGSTLVDDEFLTGLEELIQDKIKHREENEQIERMCKEKERVELEELEMEMANEEKERDYDDEVVLGVGVGNLLRMMESGQAIDGMVLLGGEVYLTGEDGNIVMSDEFAVDKEFLERLEGLIQDELKKRGELEQMEELRVGVGNLLGMMEGGRGGNVQEVTPDGAVLRVGVGDSAHNVYDGGNSDDEFAHLNGFNEEVFRMMDSGRRGNVQEVTPDGAVLRVGVGDPAHNVYDDDEFADLNGYNEEVFQMMDSGHGGNVQEVNPDGAVLKVGVGDSAHNVYDGGNRDDEFADLNGYNEEVFRMMDSGRRGNVQAESAAAGDSFKDEDICKQLFVLPTPGTSSDDESIIEE
jgi:hypothetical protein